MRTLRNMIFCCLLLSLVAFVGCGKKADENKPLGEVKAEAETMSVEKVRSMALAYKDAIVAKKEEVEKVSVKLKDIPITKMMGDEAKGLQAEIKTLSESGKALKERFEIYYDKLKEKGGDLSGLKL